MHYNDIEIAMHLKNEEGWNQTEKDWELLIKNSHNICLVAEYQQKVIGTATAINYSDKVAWIGMVLVNKKYRGQGVSQLNLTPQLPVCPFIRKWGLKMNIQSVVLQIPL